MGNTPARRRLRSSTVILGGMGALAAALTSCGSSEPDKRCVDPNSYDYVKGYRILDSSECKSSRSSSYGTGRSGKWYYDSDRSAGYADNGTFNKSAVSRGGFGCSGSGGG
ncbi:hypothetical protein [Streptomyces sp. XD-27]|uniref:hypothetical protein n=1 Tax=Streptomyces sp. XD-27 TaxID=3062779 RepID=UPI0026F40F39|nr:hypothetical protein [Streptomyces sp. XD-27]WKX70849.1 hypothetical protein Q3Y56_13900 [Streptomyces sp. XD-27]